MTRSSANQRLNPIIPRKAELGSILALIGLYLISDVVGEDQSAMNVFGPSMLFVILGAGAWNLVKGDSLMIWTPLFSFRVATGIYFGIGSLVPFFVDETSKTYLQEFYRFSDSEVAKLNLIVASMVFVVLATCRTTYMVFPPTDRMVARVNDWGEQHEAKRIRNYGLFYVIVGSLINYLVIVPVAIGWVTIVLPGALTSLAAMSLCGIYLLTVWSLASARRAFPLVCCFVALEMSVGLLMFNKTAALLPLMTFSMGLLVNKISATRVALVCCGIGLALSMMQPLVSFARDELIRRQGDYFGGSLTERYEILASYYFDPATLHSAGSVSQSGWTRVTYVNAGTFAIALYDRGYAGDSFKNMFAVLIPRVLWPDKPIDQTPREFAAMSYGEFAENSVTPTIFAEAYWNFGWLGIPMIGISLGLALALLSINVIRLLNRKAWLYMPVLLTSMQFGLSIDGLFVSSVIGGAAILVGMQLSTAIVEALMRSYGIDNPPRVPPAQQHSLSMAPVRMVR